MNTFAVRNLVVALVIVFMVVASADENSKFSTDQFQSDEEEYNGRRFFQPITNLFNGLMGMVDGSKQSSYGAAKENAVNPLGLF